MTELKIPDDLTHNCDNCQGLCCMAHKHNPRDGFPILNPKPPGVPCQHLEIGQNIEKRLYSCGIYQKLEEDGWTTCTRFSCYGAGQAVSEFFKELGVSWAQKQEELDDRQWQIRILNFRYGYQALHYVFQRMSVFRDSVSAEAYQKLREAVASASKDFCVAMERTDMDLDPNYWAKIHFERVIMKSLNDSFHEEQAQQRALNPRQNTEAPQAEVPQEATSAQEVIPTNVAHGWIHTAIAGTLSWVQSFKSDKPK